MLIPSLVRNQTSYKINIKRRGTLLDQSVSLFRKILLVVDNVLEHLSIQHGFFIMCCFRIYEVPKASQQNYVPYSDKLTTNPMRVIKKEKEQQDQT
jgi:hypothetical protein